MMKERELHRHETHSTLPAESEIEHSPSGNRHTPALNLPKPSFYITFEISVPDTIRVHTNLPHTNKLFESDVSSWMIGRDYRCAIVLPNQKISRYQAIASYEKGAGFHITDCQSQNGTFLNQKRLIPHQRYALADQDYLLLPSTPILINILKPISVQYS